MKNLYKRGRIFRLHTGKKGRPTSYVYLGKSKGYIYLKHPALGIAISIQTRTFEKELITGTWEPTKKFYTECN